MRRPRRPHWLLITVALLLAMGHVCALPGHAHAAPPPVDGEADEHRHPTPEGHRHPSPNADESHLEACEGLRSAAAQLVVVFVTAPAPLTLTRTTGDARSHQRPSFVAASPPLFLLHASLRI
jgi:hypothetical protein